MKRMRKAFRNGFFFEVAVEPTLALVPNFFPVLFHFLYEAGKKEKNTKEKLKMADDGALTVQTGGGPNSTTSKHHHKVPSYAQSNISSSLPDYSNLPSEAIHAAFLPNNYRSIQSLPLGAHQPIVTLDGEIIPFKSGTAPPTFSDFKYMASPFDITEEDRLRSRQLHEQKMRYVGNGAPFFAGFSNFSTKYEGLEYMPDPYDSAAEAARRLHDEDELRALSKPFVPPGADKALEKPTRLLLGDIMTSLYKGVSEDWPEANPTILSTKEGLVVLYFALDKITRPVGVLTYMNNALTRNHTVLQYDLRKVNEGWNVRTEDQHLMFTFRPPWVRAQEFSSRVPN